PAWRPRCTRSHGGHRLPSYPDSEVNELAPQLIWRAVGEASHPEPAAHLNPRRRVIHVERATWHQRRGLDDKLVDPRVWFRQTDVRRAEHPIGEIANAVILEVIPQARRRV